MKIGVDRHNDAWLRDLRTGRITSARPPRWKSRGLALAVVQVGAAVVAKMLVAIGQQSAVAPHPNAAGIAMGAGDAAIGAAMRELL